MDQSLVHTFSLENSYGPMVLKVLQKLPPYTGIGPWMALPRKTENAVEHADGQRERKNRKTRKIGKGGFVRLRDGFG